MKKITIISTYPENGSKNIGDYLITDSLRNVISDLCDYEVQIVFRGAKWNEVEKVVLSSDHIIFACLAIRPNIINLYPYIGNIVTSSIPFSIISAGTDLPVYRSGNIYNNFDNRTLDLLRRLNDRCFCFTTRGLLTQDFCMCNKLTKAEFTGDVAFWDNRFVNAKFIENRQIQNIAISSPHRAFAYLKSLDVLLEGVKVLFPNSKITILIHGKSKRIENFAKKRDVDFHNIYEDFNSGLDYYDNIDLHIGYRVHGHVAALKRRKYSYLLEQDGRGCDYGLTISNRISISNYSYSRVNLSLFGFISFIFNVIKGKYFASTVPPKKMLILIKSDMENGFKKFSFLENRIEEFNANVFEKIKKIVNNV